MSDAPKITVYGTTTCSYCGAARMLLTRKAVKFEDIVIHDGSEHFEEMRQRSGSRLVPQIFIGDTHIGGFDELCSLDKSGELDELLAG